MQSYILNFIHSNHYNNYNREIDKIEKKINKYKTIDNSKVWIKRIKNYYKSIYLCKYKTNKQYVKMALNFLYSLIDPTKKFNVTYKQYWKTLSECNYTLEDAPSLYFEYKVVNAIKKYKAKFPQARIDGIANIWIMKPGFSSRGIGIHCFRDIKEIRSNKVQAKVVQKYIENPFLLIIRGPTGKLEKRKFDLRQWVLITSINPLVIYMFNSCYLRICGSEFSLDDYKDKYKHLTNYSLQRHNTRIQNVNKELIMNLSEFLGHLKSVHSIDLSWEKKLFPNLAEIVKQTVCAACYTIEHHPCSFELLGFDFVLDEELNPWLLEVNLSPACTERTDWISTMLSWFCC